MIVYLVKRLATKATHAVCSTREKAEKLVELEKKKYYIISEVVEMEVDKMFNEEFKENNGENNAN